MLSINTQSPSSPATLTLSKNLPYAPTTNFGLRFQHAREPNTRGYVSIFATPRSYMFTFSASVIGHIDRSMLLLRCIALIMTLVASLSEHVKPGQVTLHVNTVLTRVVICNVYPVSVDFDPNCHDRPRSAL